MKTTLNNPTLVEHQHGQSHRSKLSRLRASLKHKYLKRSGLFEERIELFRVFLKVINESVSRHKIT